MIKSDKGSVTLIGPAILIDAELMCASKAGNRQCDDVGRDDQHDDERQGRHQKGARKV